MKRQVFTLVLLLLTACTANTPKTQKIMESIAPVPLVSGTDFLTEDTQILQADDFANPGMLWVERGETLFTKSTDEYTACASCHTDGQTSLIGAATTFPKWNKTTETLINLEGQINLCRMRYQGKEPLAYETGDLLALTAYTAHLSKGMPVEPQNQLETQANFENGKSYFTTRRGQMNFSCAQCHDENWGKKLRGDTLSQGHGNGFPAYRFEWESVGSLHRRFADCDRGVRAQPQALGSQTYIDLELYLVNRAEGLFIEPPAIRR